jgi:autotransporter translocation and assembly factor TamB
MMRRLLRLFVFLLAGVVALVGVLIAVLETSWFKERLRVYAIERATPYLNGELAIGRLDGSLFRGVELSDVSIRQSPHEVIRADAITVRYDPLRLWREGLAFDAIDVQSPSVTLTQRPGGAWNVTELIRRRGTSGGGGSFRIDALKVTDANVLIDPAEAEARHLSNVDLDGHLEYEAGQFSMTIRSLTGRDDRSGFVVDDLAGTFADGFREVRATLSGHLGESRIAARVAGRRAPSGRVLDVVADLGRLDLARILERPNFESDISGRAELEATIPDARGNTAGMTFRFRGPSARAFGYAGEAIDVTGRLEGGRVAFKGSAAAYGARATIDAHWQFSTPTGSGTGFTGTGTFVGANLTRLPTHLDIPRFESQLAGRYRLSMTNANWTADVTLRTSSLEGATIAEGTTGRLETRQGQIHYEASGQLADLNVRRLSAPLEIDLLGEPRFDGRLSGSFTAVGQSVTGRQHLTADLSLSDSLLGATTFPQMDLHVELDDRRLLVGARGAFDGLTGQLAGVETVPMDLDGTADATLVIDEIGAPIRPETIDVSGTVQLGPSTVRGLAISSAEVTGQLVDGLLTLQSASVDGASLQATATGTAALGSTGESLLDVSVHAEDLQPLGELIGRPLGGSADLSAKVTGPASHPRASGTLNTRTVRYGDAVGALTLNTAFEAEMPRLDRSAITVQAKSDATFVKVRNFEFVRVTTTARYANNEFVVDTLLEETARTLGLSGVIALEPEAQRVTLRRLDIATPTATWSTPAGREARVDIDADRVSVEGLVLGQGQQQLTIAGSLPFETPAGDSSLNVGIAGVQLADVNSLLLGTRKVEGLVTGEARVVGTLKAPAVEATMAIVQGGVDGVSFDRLQADVTYKDGLANVDGVLDQTVGARLMVKGSVPVAAPATENAVMDLRVSSTPISLALAQPLTTELTAIQGTGVFDLHVTGSYKAPVVNGSMSLDGGAFSVAGTGVDYANLVARLNFIENRLQIDEFSMADEGGHLLRVVGGVDLTGAQKEREFDVTIMADNFAVLDNALGVMRMDAILTAQGDFASPRVFGEVRVSEGRIEVDRVLEVTTSDVYSTTPLDPADGPADTAVARAAADPSSSAPPPAPGNAGVAAAVDKVAEEVEPEARGSLTSRVDLNLHLTLPDNLVLRGRDLRTAGSTMGLGDMNIIAGGELTLRKASDAATSLLGNLEIIRGYYSFQGRRFEVRPESVVRFRGLSPIDPGLNVAADRVISGVTASVEVGGTMRAPDIQLSSRPPLDEADLLSLIVFGQPVNDLGLAQRTSLSERAASMAAGAIATPIADAVANALNLDLFEIQSAAGEAPVVSLGSQIGTRLYVGVRQEVGRGDRSALSLEYRVADFLRVVTSIVHGAAEVNAARRREESGADLIFTWRY